PAGQPVSTTSTPDGGACAGLKNFSSVHDTSNACGAHRKYATSVAGMLLVPMLNATAIWSGGLSPVAATNPVVLCAWAGVAACDTWLGIWGTATRLTAASPATARARSARETRIPRITELQRRAASAISTQMPSRPSATAVETKTLALFQFWASTAGSPKLNPVGNEPVGLV